MDVAVSAMKLGALDVLDKPFSPDRLHDSTHRLYRERQSQPIIPFESSVGLYAVVGVFGEGAMGRAFKVRRGHDLYALMLLRSAIPHESSAIMRWRRFSHQAKALREVQAPTLSVW
jgi:hypothetical protein